MSESNETLLLEVADPELRRLLIELVHALGFFVLFFRELLHCRSPPFRDLETYKFSNSRRET